MADDRDTINAEAVALIDEIVQRIRAFSDASADAGAFQEAPRQVRVAAGMMSIAVDVAARAIMEFDEASWTAMLASHFRHLCANVNDHRLATKRAEGNG